MQKSNIRQSWQCEIGIASQTISHYRDVIFKVFISTLPALILKTICSNHDSVIDFIIVCINSQSVYPVKSVIFS